MILLTSILDVLRIVTGSAATVHVHASWVDNMSGTITPGRTNTAAISTAATTTIVASPGATTQRNVKTLYITNAHATASTTVTVQHFDNVNSEDLAVCTLLAGEKLALTEEGAWHHRDVQGAEYSYFGPPVQNLGQTGCLGETFPRELCTETNTTMSVSGTLNLQAIYLIAGQVINNITISSATTAAGTPTNYRFAIYNNVRALMAQTADQTTTAWAANTVKTLALTAAYRVPTSGLYYIGYLMVATTVPTLKGNTARAGTGLGALAPILQGTSTTGLTTTLPDPAAGISSSTASFYAAVT